MNKPQIGDVLYQDKDQKHPVTVIAVRGSKVFFVEGRRSIAGTHEGNLYDANGNKPWYR